MKNKVFDKNNKLGGGWQYSVYDLGNGRVYKKFNSPWVSMRIILKDRWRVFWRIPFLVREMRVNASKSFDYLEKSKLDKELFGSVEKMKGLDYEQDKVQSILTYLKNKPREEAKSIVDKFILLNSIFLTAGFIDKAVKIGTNFGINKKGGVILIDIGEIWYKKESIKKRIKIRTWAKQSNLTGLPVEVRDYYISKMDKLFLQKNNKNKIEKRD